MFIVNVQRQADKLYLKLDNALRTGTLILKGQNQKKETRKGPHIDLLKRKNHKKLNISTNGKRKKEKRKKMLLGSFWEARGSAEHIGQWFELEKAEKRHTSLGRMTSQYPSWVY